MVSNYDSQEYRKDLWEKEYSKSKGLSSSKTYNPSSSLRKYLETYSKEKNIAVDIGSGNGRNSIYLSTKGFKKVLGIELSKFACNQAIDQIKRLEINNIDILNQSIIKGIPLKDNSVDLVIDMMSMHAMNMQEREVLFSEVKRVLKPKGEFLVFTISSNSTYLNIDSENFTHETNIGIFKEESFSIQKLSKHLSPLVPIFTHEFNIKSKVHNKIINRTYLHTIFQKE